MNRDLKKGLGENTEAFLVKQQNNSVYLNT